MTETTWSTVFAVVGLAGGGVSVAAFLGSLVAVTWREGRYRQRIEDGLASVCKGQKRLEIKMDELGTRTGELEVSCGALRERCEILHSEPHE